MRRLTLNDILKLAVDLALLLRDSTEASLSRSALLVIYAMFWKIWSFETHSRASY